MQDDTDKLTPVDASGVGQGIEHGIGKNRDLGSQVAEFVAHPVRRLYYLEVLRQCTNKPSLIPNLELRNPHLV